MSWAAGAAAALRHAAARWGDLVVAVLLGCAVLADETLAGQGLSVASLAGVALSASWPSGDGHRRGR